MAQQRAWLEVPFAEKDDAKALGARWDPAARSWYAPGPRIPDALARWAPRLAIPDLLPGEDGTFGSGLFVDLVPASCWFTNVRSCVEQRDWQRLRRMVLDRAAHRCEACGAEPVRSDHAERNHPPEVHERWHYTLNAPASASATADASGGAVQTLRRLICLCRFCHETTHFGLAQVRGRDALAFVHLVEVTGMSTPAADRHVEAAFSLWRERNQRRWHLDLSMLTDAGVTLTPPRDAVARVDVADRELRQRRG